MLHVDIPTESKTAYIAGEPLNSFIPVSLLSEELYWADSNDFHKSEGIVGITEQSAVSQGVELLVFTEGLVEFNGWAWNVGKRIFLVGNVLSEIPPNAGFLVSVGHAVTSTSIFLKISEVIDLGT